MIPTTLSFDGFKITVKYVDGGEKYTDYGCWIPAEQTIVLNQNVGDKKCLETFFHEACHAIDEYGPYFKSHAALNSFSAALFRLVVGNKMCFDPGCYDWE